MSLRSTLARNWHFILLAAASLIVTTLFWDRAFPSAALQFTVSRTEAEPLNLLRAERLGPKLTDYHAATTFGEDTFTKYFLERERGIPELERQAQAGVNIWYWQTRWFKPEQEEEFTAAVDPQGRFVGYSHTIEEARALPVITPAQARQRAETFLREYVTHHPFDQLTFIAEGTEKKPHRTDYNFTWERPALRVGDASYRLYVEVYGDGVGHYNEFLKIPETWERDFNKKRELNKLCQDIAGYASVPIYLGAIVIFILFIMQQRVQWWHGVPARWLILVAVVTALSAVSELPQTFYSYDTTDKWGSYLFSKFSNTLLEMLALTLGYWLMSLIADGLYREKLPEKLPFAIGLGRGALGQAETVRGLGLGIVFACYGLGYVTLFYVISGHLGAWSPVEIDYSKTFSNVFPWLSGLEVGINAAWSEEMTFRVIGILLYWKLFRNRWIAVLLAAATWGFLHSNYPQMPGYLRGIELTVEGTLWGVLLLRYGLVTTLTAHYLYDCWLSSLVVWPSPQWDHKLGAVLVAIWPIALWLYGCWKLRQPAVAELTAHNQTPTADGPSPTATPSPEPSSPMPQFNFAFTPLTTWQRWTLLLVGLALYLAPYTWTFPQQVFRPFGHVTLTREQVAEHGAQVLRERGYKPETYHALISLSSNYTSTSYLLEHGSLAQLATLFGHEWSDTKWSIRYFRFNEKEEFRLQFDPAGKLVRWSHAIPREAPGASLEKAAALELATAYLVRERGFNPAQETLISDDLDQQEKRRDYHFIFKRQPWGWGEAELRTSIRVQGDEVVDFSRYVKIPEQWDRDRAKTGWKDALLGEGSKWTSFAIAAVMGGLLVFMIRRGLLPWRQAFLFALFPATLGLISWLNQLPWFFSGYGTTEPPNYFVLKKIGSFVFSSGSGYLGEVFRLAVALGLMRWTFGWNWTHLVRPPQERAARTRFFFDFIALLGFSLGVLVMQNSLLALINGFYFPDRTASFSVPDINNAVAFLDPLCDALRNGYSQVITLASTFALAVLIYRRFPRLLWVILLALPIARAAANDTPSEYLNALLTGEISWLLTLLLVWRFWRFHVSLIFVIYAFSPLLASIQTLLLKGGPYAWQALPLILVAAIPLAIACPSFKKSPLP